MRVCILSIGNELLKGKTVNTNAAYLAKRLTELGHEVKKIVTLPDDIMDISTEIKKTKDNYDLILITGGLGPTPDDVTVEGVAKGLNKKLVFNQKAFELVKEWTQRDNVIKKLCTLPEGCSIIENEAGVAPGFFIENILVMPGVPKEMESVFERFIKNFKKEDYFERKIVIKGKEEEILEILAKITKKYVAVEVGSYPKEGFVEILISGKLKNEVEKAFKEMRELLKK